MQPSDPDDRPTNLDASTAHGPERPGQVLRYNPKTGQRHLARRADEASRQSVNTYASGLLDKKPIVVRDPD
jgi:hypothetical protein